jgi:hypothetical protein
MSDCFELRKKIDARDPGGPPAPLSAHFREELDALHGALEAGPGIHHPLDLLIVIDLLARLYWAGEHGGPELIAAYMMEQHGWPAADAEKIGFAWHVIGGLRNRDQIQNQRSDSRRHLRRRS